MVATPPSDYREGRRFVLGDLIHDQGLLTSPIVVLDVGARDAFADTRWPALPPGMVRLNGFEPDAQECEALNRRAQGAGLDFRYHPIALAEHTGPIDFYRYAEQAANSRYPANRPLLERWCYGRALPLAKQFELIEKQTIEAKSIGDWAHAAGISEIDFCKLNIQGAELDVLRGAGPLLGSALGLVAEQTFNATYIGAPLFGETYEFIRGAEFTLFDIIGMNRVARTRSPIHITDDRIFSVTGTWPHHQLLEGHFLYFRDPILNAPEWTSDSLSPERCIKLACIAEVFGQIEFAFELLSWLAGSPRTGNMASRCREIVSNGAELYLAASQMDATVGSASFWERENGRLAAENERILTELRAQASEATRLRGEVAQLTEEREGLFASRSWRLTAPLRATRSFVDGFLQKLSGQQ